MVEKIKKSWPFILLLVILAVFALSIGAQKKWLFVDEMYSYHFVSEVEYPSINKNHGEEKLLNVWHDSSWFMDYYSIDDGEAFDFKGVYNSILQDAHPPLYYFLLHLTGSSFYRGTFSMWSGLSINFVFYILTLIALYFLSKRILNSVPASLIVVALYGFSLGAMDSFTYIRMYMMMTFFCVLFIYANVLLWEEIYSQKKPVAGKHLRTYILLFVSAVAGMLTQYYYIVYAFFVCLIFGIILLVKKQFGYALRYALVMGGALLAVYAFWPETVLDLFTGRRAGKVLTHTTEDVDKIGYLLKNISIINNEVFGGKLKWFLIVLAIAVLAVLIRNGYNRQKRQAGRANTLSNGNKEMVSVLVITVSSVLYLLFIAITALFQSDRYLFNIYPFVFLVIVYVICRLFEGVSWKNHALVFLVAAFVFMMITGYKNIGFAYLYKEYAAKTETLSAYRDVPAIYILKSNERRFVADISYVLKDMEQSVYIAKENKLKKLEKNIPDRQELIVFLDKKLKSTDSVLEKLKKMANKNDSTYLLSTKYTKVYLLQ